MIQSRSTFLKMLGLSAAAIGLSPTITQAAETTETKKDAVAL
jgi:hypothetical protein